MKSILFTSYSFLVYWLKKEDKYSLQGPFISDLYRKLKSYLTDSRKNDLDLEEIRKQLLNDQEVLAIEDFGAGSKKLKKNRFRKTSKVTKYSTTGRKFSQVYQFFCSLTPAKHVIELGTCVGINTKYLEKVTQGDLYSIEGSESLWRKAQEKSRSKSTHYILGNIKEILPEHLRQRGKVDFILIDATHNYQGTVFYFNTILPYIHHGSIVIIADIHWSAEMQKAWNEIIEFPEVTLSLDFYECGVLFFKKDLTKTHFILSI